MGNKSLDIIFYTYLAIIFIALNSFFVYNNTHPKYINVTVLDKRSGTNEYSCGKHCSEYNDGTWIRFREVKNGNAREYSEHYRDPFVAETYTIGMTYNKVNNNYDFIEIICWNVLIICISVLIFILALLFFGLITIED